MTIIFYCVFLLTLVVGGLATVQQRRLKKYSHLPPGPPPSPFFGNRLSKLFPWRTLYSLSIKYGPIVTVWNGRKPSVVCSSVQT